MAFISLDRCFIEWSSDTQPELAAWRIPGLDNAPLKWPDILTRKRVVVLAEGGSGKSTEFGELHRSLIGEGKFSFELTVKKAGERGVAGSLGPKQARRLEEWRESDQPAWFFVDSVDEAKAAGVRLLDALEHVAEAIEGAEDRAHIIFSGRPPEWEYRKDFDAFMKLLSPPTAPAEHDAIDVDDLVVKAFDGKQRQEPPSRDKALVCIMAPLSDVQIRTFANANQIQNVSAFLEGLGKSNLWSFARRPLDLDWLARYWLSHGKFASFERMLETNLTERLTETNPDRARELKLDRERALGALERLGAALVLGRMRDLEVFDSASGATPSEALRLRDALPDMPQSLQADLINAAIFVPSSVGLVRLQNDNNGIVRSYLTARWLRRLLQSNCPWSAVKNLLFADTYGVAAVKPSMAAVAAWLSIWEPRAADELVRRQPMALVEHGDASSLPTPTRQAALRSILTTLRDEEAIPLLDHDGLMRFSGSDLEDDIKTIWKSLASAGSDSEAPRQLLLRMIAEGRLRSCLSIAVDAAIAPGSDALTRVLAVQALVDVDDEPALQNYALFLRNNAPGLDVSFLWRAVDLMFPNAVTVDDLLAILPKLLGCELTAGYGIEYYGPHLAKEIVTPNDAKLLLTALMARLPQKAEEISDDEAETFSPLTDTVALLGIQILDLDPSPTPSTIAIDASLRLTALTWRHGWRENALNDLTSRLRSTPQRRRAALWRLSEIYSSIEKDSGAPLNDVWQLRMARFDAAVGLSDVDWLLEDARTRPNADERLLALRLAMFVWFHNERPDALLRQATAASNGSEAHLKAIEFWVKPPVQTQQELRLEESRAKYEAESHDREQKRKASWSAFVERIRNDPAQLETLVPPSHEGIDARIYHIWELLESLSGNSHGKSMSDVNLLKPVFGAKAIPYIESAFIRYWRLGAPKLRSERAPEEINIVTSMERLGLVGVSFEAAADPTWPIGLDDREAELATVYATLELNQFPKWFERLATAKPNPARDALRRAFASELSEAFTGERREVLERIARSPASVAALVADDMLALLSEAGSHPAALLRLVLRIAQRGGQDQNRLLQVALSKAQSASMPEVIAAYLTCAFALNGQAATAALISIAARLQVPQNSELASALLPAISGSHWHLADDEDEAPELSTEDLVALTRFAHDAVRPADDNVRSDGKVFSPNARDNAESARGMLFKQLADRPGAATFKALHQFATEENFLVPRSWIKQLARARADHDSESAPWNAPDVKAFEDDFDTVPRNPKDLQRVAMARIEDLQHRLVHSDFGLGAQVKNLEQEVDVQRWMAGELEATQGRSYTLEREPHVANEKEPDIRLSSKGSDSRLPIEIKVAESWSLSQLEEALITQLAGRYLRNRNGRWGILLLVHQHGRSQGWEASAGNFLSFDQTVERLRKLAADIAAADSTGPQMQVCVIDVSSVEGQRRAGKRPKKLKAQDHSA